MAEFEDVRMEKGEMETLRINNRVTLTKVYFGSGDDFIIISGNDMSLATRFLAAKNKFVTLTDDMTKKEKEINDKYKSDGEREGEAYEQEKCNLCVQFWEDSKEIIDGVLGDGKAVSFFADVFEAIPDFIPTPNAVADIFDGLMPVVERIIEHQKKLEEAESRSRMAKYKPQEHKKKVGA